jgi:hypothetical protein
MQGTNLPSSRISSKPELDTQLSIGMERYLEKKCRNTSKSDAKKIEIYKTNLAAPSLIIKETIAI